MEWLNVLPVADQSTVPKKIDGSFAMVIVENVAENTTLKVLYNPVYFQMRLLITVLGVLRALDHSHDPRFSLLNNGTETSGSRFVMRVLRCLQCRNLQWL